MTLNSEEPIWCEAKFSCVDPDGAVAHAKYFCFTEGRYVCEEDNKFCHKRAHNWRELKGDEKANT